MATKRVATKGATNDKGASAAKARSTSPVEGRELRRQGKRTMAKLTDAGMRVLSERGYHAARVDDIVRLAKVSHGTFYLYFSNKEDLFQRAGRGVRRRDDAPDRLARRGHRRRRWHRRVAPVAGRVRHDLPEVRRRDPGVDGGPGHESRAGSARPTHVQRDHAVAGRAAAGRARRRPRCGGGGRGDARHDRAHHVLRDVAATCRSTTTSSSTPWPR